MESIVTGLSASFHKYSNVCGERDDDAMSVCIAEEEGQRNRCGPAATLWAEGVTGDLCVSASSPPRSLTSSRKTHQQTSSYLWNETLGVLSR